MKDRKNTKKGLIGLALILLVLAGIGAWIGISFFYESDYRVFPQDIKRGLDLSGGVSITYESVSKDVTDQQMEDAHRKFQQRAEAFSTESNVYLEGKYRINVDIPGAKDAQAVLDKLGSAGSVYFIYAKDKNGVANVTEQDGKYVLARSLEDIIKDGDAPVDGSMVANAEGLATQNSAGAAVNIVSLEFNGEGAKAFGEATKWAYEQGSGLANQIAIVYDGNVISCPTVRTGAILDGKAQIEGNMTIEEAREIATFIRIGALPIEVTPIRSNIVGATLGSRALETSLIAGLIGFCLVVLFMILVYRIPGLAASISLIIYLALDLMMLLLFEVTLTLPGIAGIILSVGMAVDANVIIFTRIREEIATGKTVRSSIKLGYSKATSAIVDGNVTTLIAAIVLYFLGSGVIKGFAITLGIGIVVSMFSGLVITRLIMNCFYNLGATKPSLYGKEKKKLQLHIVENWVKYLVISCALIIVGIVMLIVNKAQTDNILNYGLDFVGGSSVQVRFDGSVPERAEVEALVKTAVQETCSVSEVAGENAIVIKTKAFLDDDVKLKALKDAFAQKYGVSEKNIETETISGSVSDEMKADAVKAVIIATICMLIYIWIRFKNIAFASSAVMALIHDVLVVLSLYAVCRITVDTSFIACMLTLVGYSINATIVIFDRIRENLSEAAGKTMDSLKGIVNRSVSETFTRSINTTITTLLTVVALIILGVDSVRIFAIPLAVGLVCGTYSSVCITGTLWYGFKTRFGKQAK